MDDHLSSPSRVLRLFGFPVAPVVLLVLAVVTLALVLSAPTPSRVAERRVPGPIADSSAPTSQSGAGNAAPLGARLGSLTESPDALSPDESGSDLIAVQRLLDARSRAVVDRDVAGYIATASARRPVGTVSAGPANASGSANAADAARDQAEALRSLPVTEFSLTLGVDSVDTSDAADDSYGADPGAADIDEDATARARATYGPDVLVVHVTLSYRLDGFDRDVVNTPHLVTVTHQRNGWAVLKDVPADGSREIWDFGRLTVARGQRSLVVGYGERESRMATLRQYADAADIGVRDVTSDWGGDWQRQVLVVAPSTRSELGATLARRTTDFRRIAAITTARLDDASSGSHGDRVFVNPKAFAQLGPRGRTILLRHEITHVATSAAAADAMPTWMEEGFADHLGYRGSGVPTSEITAELRRWLRAGGRPTQLPVDHDYDGGNGDLVEVYEQSWFATHIIAEAYGEARLVELYRSMQAETELDSDQGADEAFRSVLGVSLASFTQQWRAELLALGST